MVSNRYEALNAILARIRSQMSADFSQIQPADYFDSADSLSSIVTEKPACIVVNTARSKIDAEEGVYAESQRWEVQIVVEYPASIGWAGDSQSADNRVGTLEAGVIGILHNYHLGAGFDGILQMADDQPGAIWPEHEGYSIGYMVYPIVFEQVIKMQAASC